MFRALSLCLSLEGWRGREEEKKAREKQSGRRPLSKQKEGKDGLSTKGELTLKELLLLDLHTLTYSTDISVCPPAPSQESERLEMLNSDLKAQIEELKLERQQLILMLNRHRPTCIVRTDSVKTPESEVSPLLEQLEAKWRRWNEFLQFTIGKKRQTRSTCVWGLSRGGEPAHWALRHKMWIHCA